MVARDPLAEYKKNSDWNKYQNIIERMDSLDEISKKDAFNMFGALYNVNLGIYLLNDRGGWKRTLDPLVCKVLDKCLTIAGLPVVTYNKQANAVVIKQMTNPNRKTAYNLCSQAVGYKNVNSLEDKAQMCIVFDTPEEADNFRK